jgi:hypothetical protein
MDERELEQRMREGLELRAGQVDLGRADSLAAAAREDGPGSTGRGRGPWVMGLAAASVLAVVGGTALVLNDDDGGSGDLVADPATTPPAITDWRTEYWHDLKVDVPADWGWGGAPLADFVEVGQPPSDQLIDCGAAAYIRADGERILDGDTDVPYVGRPIMQTDACLSLGQGDWQPPTAPYVWLGSPVEVGTVDFANGYVMETTEVNGSRVSVATRDATLREQILDSAAGGETCISEYDDAPEIVAVPREGVPEPTGMTVCAYRDDADGGTARLVYATHVDAAATRAFREAVSDDGAAGTQCRTTEAHEWVLLAVEGEGGLRQDHLVTLGQCSGIELLPGGELVALTDANVAPWAVDGMPAYVVGPYGGKGATGQFFKGMLG